MSNPLISIVFTSYNHQRFLTQAIESLLAQTFSDFELIVVDDCSTDGSRDILLKYQTHPKVRLYLREINSGSYVKSTNYGAQQAKGKYLLFAQCDDFAEPIQLERLHQALLANPSVGVAFCRSRMIDENGQSLGTDFDHRSDEFRHHCAGDTKISRVQMKRFLGESCVIPNLSAALLSRELYIRVGGLSVNYLVLADWAFWLDLAQLTDFYYVAAPLNNFRQHDATIRSKIKLQRQILEIYEMFEDVIRRYPTGLSERFRLKINRARAWMVFYSASPSAWKESFKDIWKDIHQIDRLAWFYFLLAAWVRGIGFLGKKIKQLLKGVLE